MARLAASLRLRQFCALAILCAVGACGQDDIPTGPSLNAIEKGVAGVSTLTPEFRIATTTGMDFAPSVASDGTNALVAYVAGGIVKGRLVSPNGNTIATVGVHEGGLPQVAYDGTNFLMVWRSESDASQRVWGVLINRSGVKVGDSFVISQASNVKDVYGLAFGGGTYLVMYRTSENAMQARFVLPNGTLGLTRTIAQSAAGLGFSDLASDGSNFVAVYANAALNAVYTRLVRADGTLGAPRLISDDLIGNAPLGIGSSNGKYFVTWNRQVSSAVVNPWGQLLTSGGALSGTRFVISDRAAWQEAVQVIPYGTGFFVGYVNFADNGNDVAYGRPISSAGKVSAEQTYFVRNPNTLKVAIPIGVAIGTKVFFAVNRATVGADPKDFSTFTGYDVYGTMVAPQIVNPALVSGLVASGMNNWFNTYTGLKSAGALSTQARTYSASWSNGNLYYYSSVDNPASPPDEWNRLSRPWANDPAATARTSITYFFSGELNEGSLRVRGFYGTLNDVNTVMDFIHVQNAIVGDSATTRMMESVALLMQGASLMGLALNYDKAFLVDENTAPTNYSNRRQLRDAAVRKLTLAASVAAANTFTTPAAWTNGYSYTNVQIAAIANTMAAMTLAYYPRDAAENATVDWNRVANLTASGMAGGTFGFAGDGYSIWVDEMMIWFNSIDTGRLSTRVAALLDPATQTDPWPLSGNPQPNSADKRLGDGSFGNSWDAANFSTVPKTPNGGTDFAWSSRIVFRPDRGSYHESNIAHVRYDASGTQDPGGVYNGYGFMPVISATVNDLLRAEALLRTGRVGPLVVQLINKTRVTRGGLPPAKASDGLGSDADGPCTSLNKLAKDGTTKCTLMAKLLYEKEIELLGLGAAPFYEQRRLPVLAAGGRIIQGLLVGTPREMPVPYNQLQARGEPLYTWGGAGPANSPTP